MSFEGPEKKERDKLVSIGGKSDTGLDPSLYQVGAEKLKDKGNDGITDVVIINNDIDEKPKAIFLSGKDLLDAAKRTDDDNSVLSAALASGDKDEIEKALVTVFGPDSLSWDDDRWQKEIAQRISNNNLTVTGLTQTIQTKQQQLQSASSNSNS